MPDVVSRPRAASSQPGRGRQVNWSDTAYEAALHAVDAKRAALLRPAEHVEDLVNKVKYLLQLSESPLDRRIPIDSRPWKVRLLHSMAKDTFRIAEEVERNQRCEMLRRHAAGLGQSKDLAIRLQAALGELDVVKAERDAALQALERANGFSIGRF